MPQYEEISGYGNKCQLGMRSASATPRLSDKKNQIEKAKLRIPSGNITAFQDYIPTIMSALDNPWKPLNKGTTTPSWTTVPPLVFLSTPGTPISRPQTGEELEEEQIRMNFSTVDKTVLIPEGREGAESCEVFSLARLATSSATVNLSYVYSGFYSTSLLHLARVV